MGLGTEHQQFANITAWAYLASRWKRAPHLGHPESDQAASTFNYEFSGNTEKHVKLHCRDAVRKTPTMEMLQNNQLL